MLSEREMLWFVLKHLEIQYTLRKSWKISRLQCQNNGVSLQFQQTMNIVYVSNEQYKIAWYMKPCGFSVHFWNGRS